MVVVHLALYRGYLVVVISWRLHRKRIISLANIDCDAAARFTSQIGVAAKYTRMSRLSVHLAVCLLI